MKSCENDMDNVSRRFFEQEANMYDTIRNRAFISKAKTAILDIAHKVRPKRAFLEVGAGTGEVFKELAKHFEISVASDISHNMLVHARRKLSQDITKVDYIVADAQHLPFTTHSFDFVLCMDVLEHVENPRRCVNEIWRLISNNGMAAITTPNPLWGVVLYLAEKLGLKVHEGPHRYIFLPTTLRTLARITAVKRVSSLVFLPIRTPFDFLIERVAKNHLIKLLGFSQLLLLTRISRANASSTTPLAQPNRGGFRYMPSGHELRYE